MLRWTRLAARPAILGLADTAAAALRSAPPPPSPHVTYSTARLCSHLVDAQRHQDLDLCNSFLGELERRWTLDEVAATRPVVGRAFGAATARTRGAVLSPDDAGHLAPGDAVALATVLVALWQTPLQRNTQRMLLRALLRVASHLDAAGAARVLHCLGIRGDVYHRDLVSTLLDVALSGRDGLDADDMTHLVIALARLEVGDLMAPAEYRALIDAFAAACEGSGAAGLAPRLRYLVTALRDAELPHAALVPHVVAAATQVAAAAGSDELLRVLLYFDHPDVVTSPARARVVDVALVRVLDLVSARDAQGRMQLAEGQFWSLVLVLRRLTDMADDAGRRNRLVRVAAVVAMSYAEHITVRSPLLESSGSGSGASGDFWTLAGVGTLQAPSLCVAVAAFLDLADTGPVRALAVALFLGAAPHLESKRVRHLPLRHQASVLKAVLALQKAGLLTDDGSLVLAREDLDAVPRSKADPGPGAVPLAFDALAGLVAAHKAAAQGRVVTEVRGTSVLYGYAELQRTVMDLVRRQRQLVAKARHQRSKGGRENTARREARRSPSDSPRRRWAAPTQTVVDL